MEEFKQLICIIEYSSNLLITTLLSNKFNREKLIKINDEKSKQQNLLNDILKVAGILSNNSKEVYTIFGDLTSNNESVNSALGEILKETSSSVAQGITIVDKLNEQANIINNYNENVFGTINGLNQKLQSDSEKSLQAVTSLKDVNKKQNGSC